MKLLLIAFVLLTGGISSLGDTGRRPEASNTVDRQHLEQMKNVLKTLESKGGNPKRMALLRREILKVEAIVENKPLPGEPPSVFQPRKRPDSAFIYPVAVRFNIGGKYKYSRAFYSKKPSWGRIKTSEGKFWLGSCFFEVKDSPLKNLKVAVSLGVPGHLSYSLQRVRRVYEGGIVDTELGLYDGHSYFPQTYEPDLVGKTVVIIGGARNFLSIVTETYKNLVVTSDNFIYERTKIKRPIYSALTGKRVIERNFGYGIIENVFEDKFVEVKREESKVLNLKDLSFEIPSPLKGEKIAIPVESQGSLTYRVDTVDAVFENGAILDSGGNVKSKFYRQVPSDFVNQNFYGGRFNFIGRKIKTVFENDLIETQSGVVSLASGKIGPALDEMLITRCANLMKKIRNWRP